MATAEAISPSRLIRTGDVETLDRQLREGAAFVSRVKAERGRVELALQPGWLGGYDAALTSVIAEHAVPVALAFASSHDPLGSKSAVTGLRRLLASKLDVAILRCDVAGVGALATGATFSAVGLTSGTRHLYRRGPVAVDGSVVQVLIPRLLCWMHGEKVWRMDDTPLFRCPCRVCDGASVRRFREPERREEAALHAVEVWRALEDRVRAVPADERLHEWGRICSEAVRARDDLPPPVQAQLSWTPLEAWTSWK